MTTTHNHGIDYGSFPTESGRLPNRNESGTRFGIIHTNHCPSWIWDDAESVYPRACPHCGAGYDDPEWEPTDPDTLTDDDRADFVDDHGRDPSEPENPHDDSVCLSCGRSFQSDDSYGDEPTHHEISGPGWAGFIDSDGDLWITESEHRGFGRHCSPCAPGAVSWDPAATDGVPCLAPDPDFVRAIFVNE